MIKTNLILEFSQGVRERERVGECVRVTVHQTWSYGAHGASKQSKAKQRQVCREEE